LAAPDAHAAADLALKSSPNLSLAGWKSPVLFIHGDDDRNVPFTETTNIIQHLKRQNVEFEQLIFPDEIHDFLLWKDWVASYRAMGDFFQRKLK
jgi:dipeptidyl aminopeptidase/acylaminoacyl peptidase